jgi:hypothetical protein
MSKDNINMRPDFPNDDLVKRKKKVAEEDNNILIQEDDIVIWVDESSESKLVFVNMGNTTISLDEPTFYTLTKLCSVATKKLLEL